MHVAIVFKFGQPKVGTSDVIKTCGPYPANSYKPDNCGEGCNRHCTRRKKHWSIAKVFFSSMITPDSMSRELSGIPYSNLGGRLCAIYLIHLTLHQPIVTYSTPWIIIFVENSSPMKQTCIKPLQTSLLPKPGVLSQGD